MIVSVKDIAEDDPYRILTFVKCINSGWYEGCKPHKDLQEGYIYQITKVITHRTYELDHKISGAAGRFIKATEEEIERFIRFKQSSGSTI